MSEEHAVNIGCEASCVIEDPWKDLGAFTAARIALGRAGQSLPLKPYLAFKLAHARARDAVHMPFNSEGILAALSEKGIQTLHAVSAAENKHEYLTRPDKGRKLSDESYKELKAYGEAQKGAEPDICVVISDGLSARAVHENAVEFAVQFLERIKSAGFSCSPVVVVDSGRVAVGDEAAALLHARLVVILIGERPGLTSPNSLSAYMTYAPYPGVREDMRNCISNVRCDGLPIEEAVRKLCYLTEEAFARKLSGVELKDDMPSCYIPFERSLQVEFGKENHFQE